MGFVEVAAPDHDWELGVSHWRGGSELISEKISELFQNNIIKNG